MISLGGLKLLCQENADNHGLQNVDIIIGRAGRVRVRLRCGHFREITTPAEISNDWVRPAANPKRPQSPDYWRGVNRRKGRKITLTRAERKAVNELGE
jgi:hypothetical protein